MKAEPPLESAGLYFDQLNGAAPALHPNFGGGLPSFSNSCYAGRCDWRAPTIDELGTVLDFSKFDCIDSIFGITGTLRRYWSSSLQPPFQTIYQVMQFGSSCGIVFASIGDHENFRAVRALP